jgi:hypothetical protein
MNAWDLVSADGAVLGHLVQSDAEMFWTHCRFTPTEAFTRVAPRFAATLAHLEADEIEKLDAAYEHVAALHLELRPAPGSRSIGDFLLHIDGDVAWFRD